MIGAASGQIQMKTGLVWLEAKLVEAEPACRQAGLPADRQAGMIPAKGGGARPEPERALTRRDKANAFAQDKPGQSPFIHIAC
ncbi:MAG: hypothetical protein AUJ74_04335 [Candidatus Omnitrophica bacterium CG1_02_44_16]|nr:MAG: hypothetical protein AUJ74_04335 [Candidatus Omnitrophica bacterium CG1_02_44_16]PIY83943.1 MAG: hypothetical protein COY78_00605 [Candidatus Omnitrophica bacterium CG_4_10_14_0_8_um_filter_44_12]PIZ85159.1 MAG: hypothetical protein COX96_00275 [Candidatus Omnitrophica bacterium CG_4_10_14_0_2_um_filter_44_9]